MQADILDGGPNDGQATGLRREHVDLISPLAHIAEKTFNGVGRLNVPVHGSREGIKRERLLFLLSQASDRLWIALAVFGFEGRQVNECLLFGGLSPDPSEFGCHFSALSAGDSVQDIVYGLRTS